MTLAGFFHQDIFRYLAILWTLDTCLGLIGALWDKSFEPQKAVHSLVKWLVWVAVLAVSWIFNREQPEVGYPLGVAVQTALWTIEASSVFKNAASLLEKTGDPGDRGGLTSFILRLASYFSGIPNNAGLPNESQPPQVPPATT